MTSHVRACAFELVRILRLSVRTVGVGLGVPHDSGVHDHLSRGSRSSRASGASVRYAWSYGTVEVIADAVRVCGAAPAAARCGRGP